ncbi:Metallo-dependent phosphatase-like protein [Thermothelomyces heterothallicus CBS 202.75]|uniref:Metallo-dependent phosphatase-like protein n=1 Tax=Thermothelomyces heterothallicus CBS 202.75 TaxID=1149848 RepID=UPI003742E44C
MTESPSTARQTRRTRIVCISDTHNSTVKLPKGDVLIHAGDLTNQGSYSELSKAVQWLEKADFEAKIVIAGNHDITLDSDFYRKHGSSFHNQHPEDLAQCQSLLTSSRSIIYLLNSSATIRLTRPDGPGTTFTIFGSPYSPQYGTWAFMYPQSGHEPSASGSDSAAGVSPTATELWEAIPLNTDILVTHTPAYGHRDDSGGCDELRRALARVRPRLHVCGHVHQGRGAERVKWDTDSSRAGDGVTAVEASVEAWVDPSPDPASAKISLVDLTARRGNLPLDFDDPGPVGSEPERPGQGTTRGREGRKETCIVNCAIVSTSWPHKGGKRFNKPIVVDIDLPVWR